MIILYCAISFVSGILLFLLVFLKIYLNNTTANYQELISEYNCGYTDHAMGLRNKHGMGVGD